MVSQDVLPNKHLVLCFLAGQFAFSVVTAMHCAPDDTGFHPHPTDCTKFFHCSNGRTIENVCPDLTVFSYEKKACDWTNQVDCEDGRRPGMSVTEVTASPSPMTTTTQAPGVTTHHSPVTDTIPVTPSPASSPTKCSNAGKNSDKDCKRRVCYYTNWSQYRPGEGKFFPENIDFCLCSHVIYAFAKLEGNHLKAFEWNDESTPWKKGMSVVVNIKPSAPGLYHTS